MSDEEDTPSFVTPTLAGAATYLGTPAATEHVLGLPYMAAKMMQSGVPIEAEFGTPLQRLAEFTRDEVRAIRDFAQSRGVTAPIVAGSRAVAGGEGYYMSPSPIDRLLSKLRNEPLPPSHIGLTRTSLPQAMHEIGHASPIMGSERARDVFGALAHLLGQDSASGKAIRLGIASSVLAPPGEDASGVRRFVYDNAPALVGATMAPQLAEEARASFHALRGARRHGVGVGRAIAELAPALGTYVAGAAAPVIATILAKHVVQALRARQAEQNQAKTAGAEARASGALRTSASAAWRVGANPPKPKSSRPSSRPGAGASDRTPAKPPSKTSFYKDLISTLYNPQRGFRLATPD